MSEFYTLEEAAKKLKLDVKGVRRLISNKQLEVVHLSPRNPRVTEEALANIKSAKVPTVKRGNSSPAQLATRKKFSDAGKARSKAIQPPAEAVKANGTAKATK